MSFTRIFLSLVLSLLCSSAFAKLDGWYAAGSVGLGLPLKPDTSNVANGSPKPDQYQVNKVDNSPTFQLSSGLRFSLKSQWFSHYRVGLAYNFGSSYDTKGVVNQFSQLPNYNYRYTISRNTLMVNYQTDVITLKQWTPHLDAAVGVSQNKASGYQETTTLPSPRTYSIDNKAQTEFAYRLGFGVSYDLKQYGLLSVDYHYLNVGQASLGQDSVNHTGPTQDLAYNVFSLAYRKNFSF